MIRHNLTFYLTILLLPWTAAVGYGAHWAWVEQEVAPVPWDYTAFPMFMAYDKSDQKLTLVINDEDSGIVQVWKFTAPEWIKMWEGIPNLGEVSSSYAFRTVYTLYYDENLGALVLWGHCPGYQFETHCEALFKFVPGEGFEKTTTCISAHISEMSYPVMSSTFDTFRKRAVFTGPITSYVTGQQRTVTVEFDGSSIYYIPNSDDPWWDPYFAIGTTGFDPISNRVVFYGRCLDTEPLETWEYDGQIWTLVPTAQNPPTYHPIIGMSFEPDLRGLLALSNDLGLIDSWIYRNRQWEKLTIDGQFEGTLNALLAFDSAHGTPVFYGGNNENGFVNRMWALQCAAHCKPVSKP